MSVEGRWMLELSARICAAGVLIQSLELIRLRRHLSEGGLFGWTGGSSAPARSLRERLGTLHRHPWCLRLLCGRALLAAVCLALPFHSPATWWVLGGLFGLQLYCNRRLYMVQENASAMYLICFAALTIGLLPAGSSRLVLAAAGFISFQVLLAYFVSGKTKLASPAWRQGNYLAGVLEESAERLPRWAAGLRRHRGAVVGLTWGVILLEVLFPLCVFLPPVGFWIFIGGGLMFHAGITYVMGVHGFWWSFTATYPALYFIHDRLWPVVDRALFGPGAGVFPGA